MEATLAGACSGGAGVGVGVVGRIGGVEVGGEARYAVLVEHLLPVVEREQVLEVGVVEVRVVELHVHIA